MRLEHIDIIFHAYPHSAKGKYTLTLGKEYPAKLTNADLGLYELTDDVGVAFNVSTWGASYSNGGNWSIKQLKPIWGDDD